MAVPWALPAPLSPAQLKRLEQHRYSAAGRSLLEPWLQPYWAWLVEQVPLGLAPNAITLGGLLLNCLTALPLIACCPSATEQDLLPFSATVGIQMHPLQVLMDADDPYWEEDENSPPLSRSSRSRAVQFWSLGGPLL